MSENKTLTGHRRRSSAFWRSSRARVRIRFSSLVVVSGSGSASIQSSPFRSCFHKATRSASDLNLLSRIYTASLNRSEVVSSGTYQSVMITPPNGSADASGIKEEVSSEARQRNAFTPIPVPRLSPSPRKLRPPNRPPSPVRLPPPVSLSASLLGSSTSFATTTVSSWTSR